MVFYKNLIFYLKLTFFYIFLDYIDLLMLKIINFILMYLLKKKKKTTKQTLKYSLIQFPEKHSSLKSIAQLKKRLKIFRFCGALRRWRF